MVDLKLLASDGSTLTTVSVPDVDGFPAADVVEWQGRYFYAPLGVSSGYGDTGFFFSEARFYAVP